MYEFFSKLTIDNWISIFTTIMSFFMSLVAIFISLRTLKQNNELWKQSNIPYVYMYLVSSKNATYIKIKNFGKTSATIKSFSTNVDLKEYSRNSYKNIQFPYVGLNDIIIAPGASKIAFIDNNYLNKNNWIEVKYEDIENNQYSFLLDLNTYGEYALVLKSDFDLIDY